MIVAVSAPAALDELAAAANAAHHAFESAKEGVRVQMMTGLDHALAAGAALVDAKLVLKQRGGPSARWLPWLEANFAGSADSAQNYMRLARRCDELGEKKTERSVFSQREALKLIAPQKIDPALGGAAPSGDGFDSDEYYTPAEYVLAVRSVLHGIDLDPASCAVANKAVGAKRFYSKEEDGLAREWRGAVFLNPPYSRPAPFVTKLIAEHEAGRVRRAIAVLNACTDTAWFHGLAARGLVCLTLGRINFYRAAGETEGNRVGQVFFYLGTEPRRFAKVFGRFGLVGRLRGSP